MDGHRTTAAGLSLSVKEMSGQGIPNFQIRFGNFPSIPAVAQALKDLR